MKTDKAMKASGKVVKFGVNQINNPTPEMATWIFRGFFLLSTIYVVAIQPTFNLPSDTIVIIDKFLGAGNLTIWTIVRFFGWDFKN